ncbi:hypothetical protein IEQ34_004624 [Dendrobium chrysotoxum]|uniref:Uncharacterized protein n=1 Tax=Dendrobium chrysotoxum TaxID=161865 RepID=A0AAV7HEF9_DENCH|nr:hypothetical protein IEQ34_004624 [Dendrobium chrysotoxum]
MHLRSNASSVAKVMIFLSGTHHSTSLAKDVVTIPHQRNECMADPDVDFGIVYDERGFVHILHSIFFDVNPRIDNTVEEYVERILDTLVEAIEEQLSNIQWHIIPGSQ